jgi:NADPH-dependent 2,4-dienoyl-CoA reductase/sulfur reductase-like enzyme/rhodanese-related sulfurtransferase
MKTKLLIIGGVAGGATAAARARRVDEQAQITVVERGPYVSYANCGLPYFISRDIASRAKLLLQTPQGFDRRYAVQVFVDTEALEIDRAGKRVRVRRAGQERWLSYDKLILAQGGNPIAPALPGIGADHVFRLWNVPDMDRLDEFIEAHGPRTAVIVGSGFIGLEMAEAFRRREIDTTIVELLPSTMPSMDPQFGNAIASELTANGVGVVTGVSVRSVLPESKEVELSDGRRVPADLVLFSVGVRPELTLARAAGLDIGPAGGLAVDDRLRTSDPDILAVGDMVEVTNRVSGRKVRAPLAGPANRQGRIAATNALGGDLRYPGALGTSVLKVFETTVAMTGLSQRTGRDAGFDVGAALIYKDHHAGYYPGASELMLQVVYDRGTGRLLGGAAFGRAGVEKRIDVLAVALQAGMTVEQLGQLDLAYAPPYSSANDPVNVAAFVAQNDVSGFSPLITAAELHVALASATPPLVIDVRTEAEWAEGHLRGAVHIPVDELRRGWEKLPRDRRIVVYCRSGFRAHLAVRVLKQRGFRDVVNVTGGWLGLSADGSFEVEPPGHLKTLSSGRDIGAS